MKRTHIVDRDAGRCEALERARAALFRQDVLRPRNPDSGFLFSSFETQRESKTNG